MIKESKKATLPKIHHLLRKNKSRMLRSSSDAKKLKAPMFYDTLSPRHSALNIAPGLLVQVHGGQLEHNGVDRVSRLVVYTSVRNIGVMILCRASQIG